MALSILVPMSTSSLMSMPRFALVLFPMFAILARWGERPWVNNVILAFSLPLLGLFTVLFAIGIGLHDRGFARNRSRSAAAFASSSSSASSARRVSSSTSIAFTLLQQIVPNHDRPLPVLRDLLDRIPRRRRFELLPQPHLDVPLDRARGARGRAVPERLADRAGRRLARFVGAEPVARLRTHDVVHQLPSPASSSTSS